MKGHDPDRTALVEGSSLGPLADILHAARRAFGEGRDPVRPTFLVRYMTGSGGVAFAQAHGVQGTVSRPPWERVRSIPSFHAARSPCESGRARPAPHSFWPRVSVVAAQRCSSRSFRESAEGGVRGAFAPRCHTPSLFSSSGRIPGHERRHARAAHPVRSLDARKPRPGSGP